MNLFLKRSSLKEFLDEDHIPTADLYQNLKELDIINAHLGGYNATIKGIKYLLKSKEEVKSILDIGFGGGDSIRILHDYLGSINKSINYYGVDIKIDCFEYAKKNLSEKDNIQLICDDYRNISTLLLSKIDIIHCSLFIHHLKDKEIIEFFKFAKSNGCKLLINDLQRHWLAYYSIKLLTFLFSKSYLVKNDAPISVLRGFKRAELIKLLESAGFSNYKVIWSWAFRFIIIAK